MAKPRRETQLGALDALDECVVDRILTQLAVPELTTVCLVSKALRQHALMLLRTLNFDVYDFMVLPRQTRGNKVTSRGGPGAQLPSSSQLEQLPVPPHLLRPYTLTSCSYLGTKAVRIKASLDATLMSRDKLQGVIDSLGDVLPELTDLELLLREDETYYSSPLLMRLSHQVVLLRKLRAFKLDLQVSPSLRAWNMLSSSMASLTSLALIMPLSHTLLGKLSMLTALTSLEFTAAGRGRRGEGSELSSSLGILSQLSKLQRLKADGPSWPSFSEGMSAGLRGMSSLTELVLPGREGVVLPDRLLHQLLSLNMNSMANASPVELPSLTHLSCSLASMFSWTTKSIHLPALQVLSHNGECDESALAAISSLCTISSLNVMSVSDDTQSLSSLSLLSSLTKLKELKIMAEAVPPPDVLNELIGFGYGYSGRHNPGDYVPSAPWEDIFPYAHSAVATTLRSLHLVGFAADRVGNLSELSALNWLRMVPQLEHLSLTAASLPLSLLPPALTSLEVSGADPFFFGVSRFIDYEDAERLFFAAPDALPAAPQPPGRLALQHLALLAGDYSSISLPTDKHFAKPVGYGVLDCGKSLLQGGRLKSLAYTPMFCNPVRPPISAPLDREAIDWNEGFIFVPGLGEAKSPQTLASLDGQLLGGSCAEGLESLELHAPGPSANVYCINVSEYTGLDPQSWRANVKLLSESVLSHLPSLHTLSFGPRTAMYNRFALDNYCLQELESLSALTQLTEIVFGEGCDACAWSMRGGANRLNLQHLPIEERCAALCWAQASFDRASIPAGL